MKDYYEILEVSRKASKDTINKVFKMHMKANHPDLFQGEEKVKAEEKSKEYTEAYNILSDDNERAKYDAQLAEEEQSNSNPELQAMREENEYLKQVISKKDDIINRLTNPSYEVQDNINNYNQFNNTQYDNYSSYQQNPYNNNIYQRQPNPYEGLSLEELQKLKKEETKQYYIAKFKDTGIKLLILGLLLIALLISLSSSFKDLAELFGKK